MAPLPTSKTRLTACVKAFDTDAVVAGLKRRPDLLHHADERGRNWQRDPAFHTVAARLAKDIP